MSLPKVNEPMVEVFKSFAHFEISVRKQNDFIGIGVEYGQLCGVFLKYDVSFIKSLLVTKFIG